MAATVSILVNGERHETPSGANVIDLLKSLGLESGRVAIERNLEILPRPAWPQTQVASGDRFEIVQFVGGG